MMWTANFYYLDEKIQNHKMAEVKLFAHPHPILQFITLNLNNRITFNIFYTFSDTTKILIFSLSLRLPYSFKFKRFSYFVDKTSN